MAEDSRLGVGPILELREDLAPAETAEPTPARPLVNRAPAIDQQINNVIELSKAKIIPPPAVAEEAFKEEPILEAQPVMPVEPPSVAAPAPVIEFSPTVEITPEVETEAPSLEPTSEPETDIIVEGDKPSSITQDEVLALASYADLFERLLDSAFLIDAESMKVVASNPAAERLLGLHQAHFEGKGLEDFIIPEHREEFLQKLRKAKRKYYLFEFDSNWKTEDGSVKIMSFAVCKLRLKNEQEVLQINARDVTELREAQRKLKELSVTDEMTKLPNFRRFKEMLTLEHDRCARYKKEYAVIFCDVDNFKHYNDRNGHPAGDDLLRGLAKVLIKAARNTDLPARYGGEEFVVLCPEVNWEGSMILAERIRQSIASENLPHAAEQPLGCISVSIGVASFPHDGQTMEEVLHAADQALYVSKKSGRNRVTAHQAMDVPTSRKIIPPPFKPKG